jgi:hypothetical protein
VLLHVLLVLLCAQVDLIQGSQKQGILQGAGLWR